MSQLWQARFFTTVNHLRDLPSTVMPEIAFAGRSNAGKSTAINILCNQKKLAFASKTPGRTQHINYFSIGGAQVGQHRKDLTIVEEIRAMLVDLPGYGYAEVSGSAKLHWQKLLGDYVQHRTQLAALVLIIDCRRPMTDLDIQMLEWFAPTGKPIHVMLTKSDKLNRNDAANALREARTVLSNYVNADGSAYPFSVQLFSALKRSGIEDADARICALVGLTAAVPATHDAARTATVISSDGITTASVATEAPALTNVANATAPAETTVVPPVAAADTSSQDNGQDNSQDDGHDAPKTSVKKSPEERGLSSGQ